MKLLASDYDGTLRRPWVKRQDLKALRRFKAAGNIFGVVTGRGADFVLPELTFFGVPWDFLICINGGMMITRDKKEIFFHEFDLDLAKKIEAAIVSANPVYAFYGDGYRIKDLVSHRRPSLRTFVYKAYAFVFLHGHNHLNERITNFTAIIKNKADAKQLDEILKENFQGDFNWFFNGDLDVDMTPKGISKYSGVIETAKYFQADQVYVIGDSYNDLPMIEGLNGFAIDNARTEVKAAASKIYRNFTELVEDIL